MSSHAARAVAAEISAFRRSAGILCTTPPAILFFPITASYHPASRISLTRGPTAPVSPSRRVARAIPARFSSTAAS